MKSSIPSLDDAIRVSNAQENNLRNLSVEIPKNKYILVTGVSGSGKSSLVHGVIAAEAKRRYLEQLNPKVRTLLAGVKRPDVESVKGLSPVVSLDQVHASHTIRSTVGTLSGIYDHLRLLFARFGIHPEKGSNFINKSHFSFNQPEGECKHCHGIGEDEYIDPSTFILKPKRTVKDGALSLTTPTGYIIYSQVTIDVLQVVCEAEGFSLDIPWDELTAAQKNIIYFGSEAVKVPFGKHTLESRMKWTGITAKPREEGYFRGILTIMEEILKRDRNKNILKYTKSRQCGVCMGKRLNPRSLEVKWKGMDIGEWASLSIIQLEDQILTHLNSGSLSIGEQKLCNAIYNQLVSMNNLGIGYLRMNRETRSLSAGESKRIRLSSLIQPELSGLIYTLDEPTVGLHPQDHNNLLDLLKQVQNQGNTVICVDHKFFSFKRADYWLEIGPGAGRHGGEIVVDGYMTQLLKDPTKLEKSQAWSFLTHKEKLSWQPVRKKESFPIQVKGARKNNLKNINPTFLTGALNVICGVSGSGKSSLLNGVLYDKLSGQIAENIVDEIRVQNPFTKLIRVNQDPIGKSPRSNPLTYIKVFDKIRDLFAAQSKSKENGFTKSHFSFNVEGGRCSKCQGAGKIVVGMSFLGKAETDCDSCFGRRFAKEVLEVQYKGLNIADVLDLEVSSACDFFKDRPEILRSLSLLSDLGLGYLHLGQSSSTLSGGEAQRVKLVAELVKGKLSKTMYLLDEPSNGLHYHDIRILLSGLEKIIEQGNTIVIVEHDPYIVALADWIVELGPGAGEMGGQIIFEGTSESLIKGNTSMGRAIHEAKQFELSLETEAGNAQESISSIELRSVSTNNLKNIDINLPIGKIIAVTGISGSGKTSLVFDTLYARSKFQYSQIFSPYIRSLMGGSNPGEVEDVRNLLPAIGIQYNQTKGLRTSTVGTLLGINSVFRLLFSRFSTDADGHTCQLWARHFSFLDSAGACPECQGFGSVLGVSEALLITDSKLSIKDGAMRGSRPGAFFTDPDGQYMAIFYTMAGENGISTDLAWFEYSQKDRQIILFGTEVRQYQVNWNYNRKGRKGVHNFVSMWEGLIPLITKDFYKKAGTTRQVAFKQIMEDNSCELCHGTRIHPDRLRFRLMGKNMPEWLEMPVNELIEFLKNAKNDLFDKVIRVLEMTDDLGLGYLSLNRQANSLSSGEYQRIRLAGQLESGLTGLLYVLDEPGASLHPDNLKKLSKVFKKLRDQGNTIIFTEHKDDLIKTADYLLELGPGAGASGGEIVRQGYLKELDLEASDDHIYPSEFRKSFNPDNVLLAAKGIKYRNLNIPELFIPKGWVSISGVSGSGKSTLLNEIIAPAMDLHLNASRGSVAFRAKGFDIVMPESTSRRWTWSRTPMRALELDKQVFHMFSHTTAAISDGIKASHLYPLRKGLACETCQGRGSLQLSLDYLGESSRECPDCAGTGYQSQISQYFVGKLDLPAFMRLDLGNVWEYLSDNEHNKLLKTTITEVGLEYLKLGQHGHTLSTGEQQRLVLCRQLVQKVLSKQVFLFDEPTRGLDKKSRFGFCKLIRSLADLGHSIITIDHDPGVIGLSDWHIQLGPGAGYEGGQIVYEGQSD